MHIATTTTVLSSSLTSKWKSVFSNLKSTVTVFVLLVLDRNNCLTRAEKKLCMQSGERNTISPHEHHFVVATRQKCVLLKPSTWQCYSKYSLNNRRHLYRNACHKTSRIRIGWSFSCEISSTSLIFSVSATNIQRIRSFSSLTSRRAKDDRALCWFFSVQKRERASVLLGRLVGHSCLRRNEIITFWCSIEMTGKRDVCF